MPSGKSWRNRSAGEIGSVWRAGSRAGVRGHEGVLGEELGGAASGGDAPGGCALAL